MTVSIRSVGTVVPPTVLPQPAARDLFLRQPGLSALGRRRLAALFDASGIDTRHTVLSELAGPPGPPARPSAVLDQVTGLLADPGTGRRSELYRAEASELFVAAAKAALAAAPGVRPSDITHLVTASCTGFHAPGPELAVVRALGLAPGVARTHVGFMGCYAAFPALRTAVDACRADPSAVALVVCVELCTLHLRVDDDPDTALSCSLFGDGGAAAVVSAGPVEPGTSVLEVQRFGSALVPDGETEMAWTVGDHGFEMVLTGRVPRLVGRHVRAALRPLLGEVEPAAVPLWAVHPGGRSILDRVQAALGLTDAQLAPSREVLRRYGNMSSPTVLFVLRDLLADAAAAPAAPAGQGEPVVALAFGPGLTVESALLTWRVG